MKKCVNSGREKDAVVVFWSGFAECHCPVCDQMICIKDDKYVNHDHENENEDEDESKST